MRGKKVRALHILLAGLAAGLLNACGGASMAQPKGVTGQGLELKRAVLYQNGIGYFERRGRITGDQFTVRIRADQVNDFLKSLTVIDTVGGKAVSVSLPLDRNAAREVMELANRIREGISLPEILESLKGTEVTLIGEKRSMAGRILSVDLVEQETGTNWRVSVMGKSAIQTAMLADVETVHVAEGFIALGLHKGLDAAATGGIFKVVDVSVHLDHEGEHDLLVSYVVACPAWKPSYRLVVGEKDEVLLQGWAVVDNVTGEPWEQISLSLTSGAPLAFEYDLYAPRFVARPDLSHVASQKSARAAVGETSYESSANDEAEEAVAEPKPAAPMEEVLKEQLDGLGYAEDAKSAGGAPKTKARMKRSAPSSRPLRVLSDKSLPNDMAAEAAPPPPPAPTVTMDTLQQSARSMVTASRASGAVRYDLQDPVSVPDRSATLVSILNHRVPGEEAFLYTPGGAGQGYENNPYRVVRFRNATGFILEPGPISIYSGGTFVGEGIGESISDNKQATIPFAVNPDILVTSSREQRQEGARLIKIERGVMTVESFDRIKTTYRIKGGEGSYRLYVRHGKAGGLYELKDPPAETEDLGDAFMIPISVTHKNKETVYTAVEQTPVRRSLTIWDRDAVLALELLVQDVADLPGEQRAKLEKILEKRRAIGAVDTKLDHLQRQKFELDERTRQTRENLQALKKNKAAAALKARLAKKLEEQSKEADEVAKQIVALTAERQELAVTLEESLADLTLEP